MSIRRLPWRLLTLVIFAASALILTTASGNPAGLGQSSPSINLSPGQGPPSTYVTVTGSGWAAKAVGRIHWDGADGTVLGAFSVNPNGAFLVEVTIPGNATPGGHKIFACTDPISPFFPQICASRSFKVTGSQPTAPPATLPPATLRPVTPTPSECEVRHMPGETVIDFEEFSVGQVLTGVTLPQGVRFVGDTDMRVFSPSVETHSGSKALRMDYAGEFGSGGAMMRIRFTNVQDFVGMYVGLDEQIWATSPITAILSAYALDGSVIGGDSVSFGPAATPIRKCLSVSAPGIVEVELTYGGAGEPEVIDDLVLRGPATPVPVPGDDQPPVVTILMPEEGTIFDNTGIRLQGEVREDRELASLRYRINTGEPHELAFTSAGITPEGDHLYLFAVEPLPVAEMNQCGEYILVDVVATDISGNEGMDATAFSIYIGDLEILDAKPVQTVYDASLVNGKGTAFRVTVRSTFACDVSTEFLLELPDAEWSTLPPATGNYMSPVEAGWEYPDTWGPVSIPAGVADYAVMLPLVPTGQESAAFSAANPTGVIAGQLVDGVEGPDVRVVPRPIAENVTFAVEIDPAHMYLEQDESNNRFVSRSYPVITTRSFCFYIVPVLSGGTGPETANLNIKEQVEFLLAIFPFADSKVTWKMAPVYHMTCPHDPTMDCDWAKRDREGYAGRANLDALRAECDVAVLIGHGWNGNSCLYCREGATLGDGSGTAVLAHEFSHGWVGVEDIYSLDCMVDWDEFYCEYDDGHREYYCQDDAIAKPSDYVGANCYCNNPGALECSSAEMTCVTEAKVCEAFTGCSPFRRTEACQAAAEDQLCDVACAEQVVMSDCEGELLYRKGPDCRIRHETTEGFWVNKWLPQPAGQPYIMDCASGGWPAWMRLGPAEDHCEPGKYFSDGYYNALHSPDFVTGDDPEALLVRGVIFRNGAVELQPFLYLAHANLDRAEGAAGDYRFVLYGENGEVLSQTGIEVAFERTGADGGLTDRMPFALRIAWAEGTRRVAVQAPDGQEVASMPVSSHAPRVRLLSPNGGETWVQGRPQSIRWEASDADGDTLSYYVDISPNGGKDWWPVDSDLTGTEYDMETEPYAAGSAYLLRVVATDGVNTTSDVSDAAITVIESTTSVPPWIFVAGIAVTGLAGLTMLVVGMRVTGRGRRSTRPAR